MRNRKPTLHVICTDCGERMHRWDAATWVCIDCTRVLPAAARVAGARRDALADAKAATLKLTDELGAALMATFDQLGRDLDAIDAGGRP
jgi:hypothetical protein